MADEENNETGAESPETTPKATTRKKAVRKKAPARAAESAMDDEGNTDAPAEVPTMPAAAPEPQPSMAAADMEFGRDG